MIDLRNLTIKKAHDHFKNGDFTVTDLVNEYLKVIKEKIQDLGFNRTRFAIIANKEGDNSKAKKTSIIFSLKDAPGALLHVLAPLEENKINMTKIESRPSKKKA